jgi:hypothetical protein
MTQPNDQTVSPATEMAAVGLHAVVRRRWLYEVTDFDDASSYVDENGNEISRDDAREHIATDAEAATEADRRADLWETKQDALVARVTRHSQGKVSEPSNAAGERQPPANKEKV